VEAQNSAESCLRNTALNDVLGNTHESEVVTHTQLTVLETNGMISSEMDLQHGVNDTMNVCDNEMQKKLWTQEETVCDNEMQRNLWTYEEKICDNEMQRNLWT
jgi:hypothetical protein